MSEIINWMGGWPKEGMMNAAEWEERAAAAARRAEVGDSALSIDVDRRQREALMKIGWLGLGGDAGRTRFFPTAGADAAVERVTRTWLAPGDAVLVERPTGRAALHAFRKAGVVPHPVRGDRHGMNPDELALALERLQPRLVYAAPNCTDPEGREWSEERKRALIEKCRLAGVPVLIDDRQAILREDTSRSSSFEAIGAMRRGDTADGNGPPPMIWTVGELPPGTVAGLRYGWIEASGGPEEWYASLADERLALGLAPLAERLALLALAEEDGLEPLLMAMRFVCHAKKGVLTEQLRRQRLPETTWAEPQGGMHLWLTLPEGLDGDALLRAAWLNGLLFQPGGAFYASDADSCKLRLTVVHSDEKIIREGVQRLGATMADFLGRWG